MHTQSNYFSCIGNHSKKGVIAQACNLSSLEAELRRFLSLRTALESWCILGYIQHCLKKKNNNNSNKTQFKCIKSKSLWSIKVVPLMFLINKHI